LREKSEIGKPWKQVEEMSAAASRGQRLLRIALLGNAGFSLLSGIIIYGWREKLFHALGISERFNALLLSVPLAIFALWLLINAVRSEINLLEARLAVAMDFVWVALSLPVLVFLPLNGLGTLVVAIVAAIVLCFAISQWLGISRIRKNG